VLDLGRVVVGRQAPPPADATDVRIDNHAGPAKRAADDHIGGLAAHAAELQQVLHGARHHAVEPLNECAGHADDRPRFLVVEARGADVLLQFALVGRRKV
jgi:hypothetical protein